MINHKDLILGTSLWGWTVKKKECYKILDTFYNNGYRWIDTATNYPINSDKKYFRYAENLIAEWIKNNDINDLKIISKIGSLNNFGGRNVYLSYSFILMNYEYYLDKFQSCFNNIMVHWDNRDSKLSIESTINALKVINQNGVGIGLSGIKNPEHYSVLKNELDIKNSNISILETHQSEIFWSKVKNLEVFTASKNNILRIVIPPSQCVQLIYQFSNNF